MYPTKRLRPPTNSAANLPLPQAPSLQILTICNFSHPAFFPLDPTVSARHSSPTPLSAASPPPAYSAHKATPPASSTSADQFQVGFLTEWQLYAQQIAGDSWKGEKMDKAKVDKMSDQQIGQLYELMNAIRKQELEDNDPEYVAEKKN
ncbi:hypothetical protein GRF29_103g210466 [Pseudopithomyces chartarum]|uniref:Succinate dehydrogenase assembly factor 3, mitochondrial n=1 Tax=Pseudopithomyces chartarum TaxID=1892770 RepID=A0AAN6LXU8_9PLEO|nr:hypothetical protein GRF29_103g210466 [Pseudopithomyces chartarum]